MKYIELQREFETKIGSLDSISKEKMSSDDVFYWINVGLDSFIRERIPSSIQASQILTDDLSTLIKTLSINEDDQRYSMTGDGTLIRIKYKIDKDLAESNDYWVAVGENVVITSNDDEWPKTTLGSPIRKTVDVIECTVENITSRLNNHLSDHLIHNGSAKPLRVFTDNEIRLYTDGRYYIYEYELVYLRRPFKINITNDNAFLPYEDMPDHTHIDIVNRAVLEYYNYNRSTNSSKPESIKQ
jgi:hypothetical protein